MSATILDGLALARQIQSEVAQDVAGFTQSTGVVPCLTAVLVGDDPGSEVYVRNKREACRKLSIDGRVERLPATTSLDELLVLVERLNADPRVHGILVQLPLPPSVDAARVLEAVNPAKDVDCFHPENVGRLVQGRPRFLPCTPHGIRRLLARHSIETAGRRVVILGRSDIVGKPLANMLVARGPGGDATVTVCHTRTRNVEEITRQADILVAAMGRPRLVTAAMVKPGAVVIDVGMNRTEAGLCGDVDFEAVRDVAGMITPVPGGVGPLTVAMLMVNTLAAARLQQP
ncbi:MAG: bifunctional 5,10-methylenetetrahydrofolate dehydrogenase/5,10-methenyltetrahydrofolate cyclohydrolase [Planctomycetia bacterium]|nr:bifunctional 5,10-methylenetetrahydrofolate dehydrogenase/5,10-methenyltetrahydrofolate cyclohydrolase [Planctomycetia bacterium]